ncbi:Cytochrome c551 peroxidase precursor [Enhygromyxa salina]|uniref:Cytochrome c551 peroxidase n=1 Tax=Enhygromyxa salina TaxID=215803 RepID=A0A2S9YBR7_9BACT|nr:cytochrome c peroxidase [Enhygromyxa salina]PRQ02550.1 Cytochrome c551 peroxidase precursor [Enhygromyxa salina]
MIRARAVCSSFVFVGTLAFVPGCGKDSTKADSNKKTADKGAVDKAPPDKGSADDKAPPTEAREWAWTLPKGLSEPPPVPAENPMTAAKVGLGHQLFMDKRLSGDGSRSCYSCHQNELGGADGRTLALGAGDKPLTRNTPTIWNVAYHQNGLYWDGRAPTLEKQMLGAWKGGNMGVGEDNLAAKAKEIGALPEYAPEFAVAFGLEPGAEVTPEHVAMAVSAYERTLLCGDTAFDKGEMDEAAQRGWDLFRGKASCSTCHAGDNLSDGAFHNVGTSHDASGALLADADVGQGKPSGAEENNYKFRTPTLRNVTKTAPYFHNGSVDDLTEVVRYMAAGGNAKAPGIDPNLRNTQLSEAEIADVVAFLGALECPGSLEVIGDQSVGGIPEGPIEAGPEAEPEPSPEAAN